MERLTAGVPPEATAAGAELPHCSVLMPVHNGERYVAQAIESVLGQTHRSFEFLILDDGSQDATPAILAHYAERDARIRVFRHPNMDQPATLNRGLELARHEWVAILDHDDVALPHRLERQLAAAAREPEARVIGAHAIEINVAGEPLRKRTLGPTTAAEFRAWRDSGRRVPIVHPSALFHRPTILELGGYDPSFGSSADTELWSRVASRHAIVVVPEPLVLYRIHGQSMSFRRMFEQRERLRWILAREQARERGTLLPSLAAFRAERGLASPRLWRERRHDLFWFCRSHCLLAQGEGRRLAAGGFAAAAALVAPENGLSLAGRILSREGTASPGEALARALGHGRRAPPAVDRAAG